MSMGDASRSTAARSAGVDSARPRSSRATVSAFSPPAVPTLASAFSTAGFPGFTGSPLVPVGVRAAAVVAMLVIPPPAAGVRAGGRDRRARRVPRPVRFGRRSPWSRANRWRSTHRRETVPACRSGAGPQSADSGVGAKVAVRSRVTKKSRTFAPRAAGSSRSNSGRYLARRTETGSSMSSWATDWDRARYWPPSVSPEASVRSKTHWTGVPSAAKKGCRSTLRS